ncbi:hypothetical protein GMOD_00000981 [Pyrenophora seminiperda CCB06]|uniref:leucine--tRNA ligase n=1 Tax=Pyrenophora seminiperda CCB06 TaxID=1302712 RepID=A0A3M7LXZ2_9PLEO|nr:hypothetical protein GMOD_00000981 [Pyrenophora seminiperda CCB06]
MVHLRLLCYVNGEACLHSRRLLCRHGTSSRFGASTSSKNCDCWLGIIELRIPPYQVQCVRVGYGMRTRLADATSQSALGPAMCPPSCRPVYANSLTMQEPKQKQEEEGRLNQLTSKWQPHWNQLSEQGGWDKLRTSIRGNRYVLPMFPYPSGTLHLGHLRVYTISDVLARFWHMQGYKVLHPIGWDAFGLPAENAAIERGVHPEKWTLQNIDAMKRQMEQMGGRWDWDAEIRTCDPNFYKHTQRIFLMLHQRGLAYQAKSLVNYDPVDQTVLANEQVDANGCSWRSGAKVEKVMLKQWFLKIKEFQEPLLKDLDNLAMNGRWPDKVINMQKNWIGKSEGAKLWFDVVSTDSSMRFEPIEIFTTRADTLFGVQYIALSLLHPVVQQLAMEDESLRTFLDRAKKLPPDSKEGFLLKKIVARNPLAHVGGLTGPSIPVYVAPYVLSDYGSGAVMGVPGHDTRDHTFWRKNRGAEPIRLVVTTKQGDLPLPLIPSSGEDVPITEEGYVVADIERFGNMASKQAANQVVQAILESGKPVVKTTNWRLRDWLISRQRYWGTPIPIVHCASCGAVPVPEENLPVELPDLPDSFFQGRRGNPLAEDKNWKKTSCPKCGSAAERETDTMDTFMDSSWYFFRFLDPKNEHALVDPDKTKRRMPVDVYVGGVEHAILHLLYARFISKFLATTPTWPLGYLTNGEPFTRLLAQGMVHGETFTDPKSGRYLRPDEVDLSNPSKPYIKGSLSAPNVTYEKMSKSKYNGVDPGAIISKYGADVTRAHMLFQAPVGDVLEWDEKKITGVDRWLKRVIRLSIAFWLPDADEREFIVPSQPDATILEILRGLVVPKMKYINDTREGLLSHLKMGEAKLWQKTQQIIARVTDSYSQTYSLNTIVSDLMTLTNIIWDTPHESYKTPYLKWYSMAHLVRMLAPIAPGVAEEAWLRLHTIRNQRVSDSSTVFAAGFPTSDDSILSYPIATQNCVVQVDGKRKFEVEIDKFLHGPGPSDKVLYSRFVLEQLTETELGKEWLDRETGKLWKAAGTDEVESYFGLLPKGWTAIVVKRKDGSLCNFVSKKTRDPSNRDISQSSCPNPELRYLRPTTSVIIAERVSNHRYGIQFPQTHQLTILHNNAIRSNPPGIAAKNSPLLLDTRPYTATCPSPKCECATTPPDLDIDRKTPLLNTMAPYSEQVIFCTGKEDWVSNIEQEEGETGNFVKGLKGVIGKGSPAFDPFTNVLITASSLPKSDHPGATTALLFPSFKRIPNIPHIPEAFSNFATAYLKAKRLHPMHDALSTSQKAALSRDESKASALPRAEAITTPTILICGHGGRDKRCGILGPLLQSSFRHEFQRRGIQADVGLISHIGGHKYAGNVILYLPPSMQGNALKGSGIWYGRVGPENVEGVVEETVVRGRVIMELLRGGVMQGGGNIGRMVEAQLKRESGEEEESDGGLRLMARARG